MPARPDAPNVLKVEFLWSQDGIPAATIQYVLYSGTAPTAAACAAIAQSLATAFWPDVQPYYPATTEFVACRVTDLTTSTGHSGTYSYASAGTSAYLSCGAQCSVLVNHTISRRYRGGHPRTYYPAPAWHELATPSTWQPELITAMGNAQAAFALEASSFSDSGCTGVYVVNVSYVTGGAPRVAPVIDQITGSVVSGVVRTQRRRITASSY